MSIKVFVPSHITGFFSIINNSNPLMKGSRGAGIVLDKGVITTVDFNDDSDETLIKINGKIDEYNAVITFKVLDLLKKSFNLDSSLIINHEIELPIGCGFGTSAASALSTTLSVSKLLNLPLSFKDMASIAHQAEVELGTGLGDLIAEANGGIVLRLKEGPPGYGEIKKITNDSLYVISKVVGDIDTSSVIGDPEYINKINSAGEGMLNLLNKDFTVENFMELSYDFARKTSLISDEVQEIINVLNSETIGASMAMMGNTAFAISNSPDTSLKDVIITKINNTGPKYL